MKKKVVIIISVIFIIFAMSLVLLYLKNEKPIVIYTDDEIKFKEEYEKFNNSEFLFNVSIPSDNNIFYSSYNEITNLLKKGTNIIYIGNSENNKCRKIVNILIPLLMDNKIDKIYYYDTKENSKQSKQLYNEIIKVINKDEVEDLNNTEIDIPLILFIKDDEYLGSYVNNNENEITEEEETILKNEILKYINIMNSNVCEEDKGC